MPLVKKPPHEPSPLAPGVTDVSMALTQGNADERWRAARGVRGTAADIAALGGALSTERDVRVREAIFSSLVRIGGAESVGFILPHLRAEDAGLRTAALDALKAMPRATAPRLAEILHDLDPDVRLLACEITRELTGAEATALLCDLLEHEEDVNVCGAAVEVLAEIGESEALPVLALCADRFAYEPFLVFAIGEASTRIASPPPTSPG